MTAHGGTRRRVGRSLAWLLPLAAIAVVVVGSAQARPVSAKYDAYVTPAAAPGGGAAKLTFSITNETSSQQTIGAADFYAPAGFTIQPATVGTPTATDGNPWGACVGDGTTCGAASNVLQLAAASSGAGLSAGATVSVTATVQYTCSAGETATWTSATVQGNSFGGANTGSTNNFALTLADLQPLGSFSIDALGTQQTGKKFTVSVRAKDTCGSPKTSPNYNGGAPYTGVSAPTASSTEFRFGLTGATFGTLSWANGIGTQQITPAVAETGNTVTYTDNLSGITATSNRFDVVDTICSGGPCHAASTGNGATIDAPAPPGSGKLGLGFNYAPSTLGFTCGSSTSSVGSLIAVVDPLNYPDPSQTFDVTITYSKSITGGGSAASFAVCLGKLNESTNTVKWSLLPACDATNTSECVVSEGRVQGGALQIVVRLTPSDPYGGLPS